MGKPQRHRRDTMSTVRWWNMSATRGSWWRALGRSSVWTENGHPRPCVLVMCAQYQSLSTSLSTLCFYSYTRINYILKMNICLWNFHRGEQYMWRYTCSWSRQRVPCDSPLSPWDVSRVQLWRSIYDDRSEIHYVYQRKLDPATSVHWWEHTSIVDI